MKNMRTKLMVSMLLVLMVVSIAAIVPTVSAHEQYNWKVVWVKILDSTRASNLGASHRVGYKIEIAGAMDYWESEFGAPLDLGPYWQEEWATYSSAWTFLTDYENNEIQLDTGYSVPRGGRIFMIDGLMTIGNNVWLGDSRGSMFDGSGHDWSWSGSICVLLQRKVFYWGGSHTIDTSRADVRAIAKRGFGTVMGMSTCWAGDHIPFYTCLMESFIGGGGAVAQYLCNPCYSWFINNVADPRGWY